MASSTITTKPMGRSKVLDIDRIEELMQEYPGMQFHSSEVQAVFQAIVRADNCKLLVFGLGNDSKLWSRLNSGGRTVFIEDDPGWHKTISQRHPELESYLAVYPNNITEWRRLIDKPDQLRLELPKSINETSWDVILVDAPAGYDATAFLPGRMSSIYMASKLIRPGGEVFVHDAQREVESAYCERYLGVNNFFASTKGRAWLQAYRMRSSPKKTSTIDYGGDVRSDGAFYGGYLVLSVEPTILICAATQKNVVDTVVADFPNGLQPDIVIEMLLQGVNRNRMSKLAKQYLAQPDGIRRMVMTNTKGEDGYRLRNGVDGFTCSREIFASEDVFQIQESVQQYNAIYTVSLDKAKRHRLARKIEHLRLLAGGSAGSYSKHGLKKLTQKKINQLDLHESVTANAGNLSPAAVCAEINRSACGLLLSPAEGMTQASTQYLLCGKPVVSIASRGDRNVYFDDYTSVIVPNDEDVIWDTVNTLVCKRRDAAEIRRRTLNRINQHRYQFARHICRIRAQYGRDDITPELMMVELFLGDRNFTHRFIRCRADAPSLDAFAYNVDSTRQYFTCSDNFHLREADAGYDLLETQKDSVVVNLETSKAWVLSRIDGSTTIANIIDQVSRKFPMEINIAEEVRDTIADFIGLGVLSFGQSQTFEP
jgi:uncharacterized protein (TIGR01627 family)